MRPVRLLVAVALAAMMMLATMPVAGAHLIETPGTSGAAGNGNSAAHSGGLVIACMVTADNPSAVTFSFPPDPPCGAFQPGR